MALHNVSPLESRKSGKAGNNGADSGIGELTFLKKVVPITKMLVPYPEPASPRCHGEKRAK
jgi:hypothetical protein